MKFAEVARELNSPWEFGSNSELGQLIQRGISNRTKGIAEYLVKSKHRFLGGLVIAPASDWFVSGFVIHCVVLHVDSYRRRGCVAKQIEACFVL